MNTIGFVKTPEEFALLMQEYPKANNLEGLYVAWLTKPEIVAKVIPSHLQMVLPVVSAYIINVQEANFAQRYLEACLAIPVTYNGVMGNYVVSMQLSGPGAQMASFTGREGLGTPKKIAEDIKITRVGDYVKTYVERDGIRIIELEAEIGQYNTPEAKEIFGEVAPGSQVERFAYFYKFDLDQDEEGRRNFSNTKLIQHTTRTFYKEWEPATAKVTLLPSINDPWAELEVVQVLGAGYSRNDLHMVSSKIVYRPEALDAIPYLLAGRFDAGVLRKPIRNFA